MSTIQEQWIPSPHFSSGDPQKVKGAFHTTQGAETIGSLGSWFQNPAAQCSSHFGADAFTTVFGAYVSETDTAWTQGGMNGLCESIELCGYAEWSRDTWLGSKHLLTENAGRWMRYIHDKYKIPLTWLNSSASQDSWSKGFCQHVDFGQKGSGHWDCGDGFPTDKVLEIAKSGGGSTPTPAPEMAGINMPSSVYAGGLHSAGIWQDGRPHYKYEDDDWYQIDRGEPPFKALSGADITVTPTGLLIVTVTGLDKNMWTFQQPLPPGGGAAIIGKWGKYNRGGHNSLR